MSNIRVTYSGLIAFLVSILGVITGTIFVIIVTRKLSPEDFGLWTLIGSVISYVTIIEPIVTYWTTRQIARGEKVAKTAIFTSSILSLGGLVAYIILSITISSSLGANWFVMLLSSILVPLTFVENILNAISMGYKPHVVSYGIISFELSKIPTGFIFVVLFQLGIVGAIISTIVATAVKVVILSVMTKNQLIGIIQFQSIKFWIRMSWLTVYSSLFGLISRLDVLIVSFMTGSFVGLAYWGVANTITNLISYSGRLSQGLYPKLLAEGKKEYAEESFKRNMYLAIPILGASIVFAKPLLHILNPVYANGFYVVFFLSIKSFLNLLLGFFFSILESYERVDVNKESTFKQYLKSKLFMLPTLNLVLSFAYVSILVIFLLLKTPEMTPISIITNWSIIFLIVHIPFVAYGIVKVRKMYNVSLSLTLITKFSGATAFASLIIFYISENVLIYQHSIWAFLPQLVSLLALGGLIYFGITYVIDESTRKLFRSIFSELRKT